jgi:Leucine-rich repeat (LRR) protein
VEDQNLTVLNAFPEMAENLMSIDLENNKITEINSEIFENLKRLKKLVLSRNRIGFLDPRSFVGLEKLEVLRLKRNYLEKIVRNTFEPLKNLLELDVSFNRLQNVENIFPIAGFPGLKFLNLRNNKIKSFNFCTTEKLNNLEELILTNNKLVSISLADCPASTVALNQNELITLELRKTKNLYVLGNNIKHLVIHEFQGYEVISDLRHAINYDRLELIRIVESGESADQIMSDRFGKIVAVLMHFDVIDLRSWRASIKNVTGGLMGIDFVRR